MNNYRILISSLKVKNKAVRLVLCLYGTKLTKSSHLEDDNPGIGNVVKVDGSFVGVAVPGMTPGVVPVPVDTEPRYTDAAVGQRLGAQAQRLAVQGVVFVQAARPASLAAGRDVVTGHDAVVNRQGADEGSLVILVGHVVGPRQTDTRSAGSVGGRRW